MTEIKFIRINENREVGFSVKNQHVLKFSEKKFSPTEESSSSKLPIEH
jgi:hypothetical protein